MSGGPGGAAACDLLVRKRQAERRLPSVSGAVFRGGELLWYGAAGAADLATGEAPTSDTQYRYGSITKTFTAVLVLQLRDAGRLDLDDRIGEHLPEAKHGEPTVRRLLSHLSGLQREPAGAVWETLDVPSRDDLLANLAEATMVLPAHRRFHYSNLAYALLGELVARLSDAPWEDVLRNRLLAPLGLARTTLTPEAPYATGYLVDPYADRATPEPVMSMGGVAPAAELWGSTADLARWGAFLLSPDPAVLAPATLDEMCSVHAMTDDAWTVGFGLGLMLFRRGERVLAGHTGGMPGHLAGLAVARKDGVGAATFANNTALFEPGGFAVDLVEEWLAHEPSPVEPWAPGEPVPAAYESALGRWWTEGSEYVFTWRAGHLEARPAGAPATAPPAVFEPVADDELVVVSGRECGEPLRLVRDASGTVVKLYWATYPCTRAALVFGAS